MHHFKTLRTRRFSCAVPTILFFALVTFGCPTSKNQVTGSDFGFSAESVPEGILLNFRNIPSDAVRMTIHVTIPDETAYGVSSSFADLRDASFTVGDNPSIQLERVKETGKVIFPIVQAGQEYYVSAYVYNQREHDLMLNNDESHQPTFAETTVIAKSGTVYNRSDVRLELNDSASVATLTSEPVFSSDVDFADRKYSFGVTIIVPEKGSIGIADYQYPDSLSADGLTWTFEPQMTQTLQSTPNWLETGENYTAWASVHANILYDDIFWYVELTKSPEFTYSL